MSNAPDQAMGALKLTVILEPDEEGGFVAHCPELKGCWSYGETEEEALTNIREAIVGILRVRVKSTFSTSERRGAGISLRTGRRM